MFCIDNLLSCQAQGLDGMLIKSLGLTIFILISLIDIKKTVYGYIHQCNDKFSFFLFPIQAGSPVNHILQVTDLHWDPQYTEGLTTQCGEPLCCRPPNPKGMGMEYYDYSNTRT